MKVINPEGQASLLEAARSVAGDRLPWIDVDEMSEALEKTIKDAVQRNLINASEDFADEIVAWIMELEVWFGRCTDDDIVLEIMSDIEPVFAVTVLDMLLTEVEIMDDADADEQPSGLSSQEIVRQRIVKTLRAMADRVEQYQPKGGDSHGPETENHAGR